MKFKIFAGVQNLNEGAECKGVFKFDNVQEAEQYALDEALEIYSEYEGTAYKSLDTIIEENNIDTATEAGEQKAYKLYLQEAENWIIHYAEEE